MDLGGKGTHGNDPSGKFYKANPSDAFTEDPITRAEVGYTPVIWKVWFRLDVSRCIDEYDQYMFTDGWSNGCAEDASYILIMANEDSTNGSNGSNGSSGSIESMNTFINRIEYADHRQELGYMGGPKFYKIFQFRNMQARTNMII